MIFPSLRRNFFFAGFAVIAMISTGCGLDTTMYLYPITVSLNYPSSDSAYNYFGFRTADEDNQDNDPSIKGFEVYYLIYGSDGSSDSGRSTDVAAISSYNENYPSSALSYLVNTKGYSRMSNVDRLSSIPSIPANGGTDQNVYIRLFSVNSSYPAAFQTINASPSDRGYPLRTLDGISLNSENYYFDFDSISSGEDDVKNSVTTVTQWLVQAYAVTYGYDENYSPAYSALFNLGYVTITDVDYATP